MRLITSPSVYVVGRQAVDEEELDKFLSDHGVSWESDSEVAAEVLTETAGRTCYMSFVKPRPGGNSAYLGHIKEVGHGSVLEHAVWNLLIAGVSRSLTHELVRHRAGISPSQLSQRYVDESVAEFVVPPDLQDEVKAADEYIGSHLENWVCAVAGQLADHDPVDRAWIAVEKISSGDWEHPGDAAYHGLLWLRSAARSQDTYKQLSDYLAKKAAGRGLEKTEARKFARQAARSVLPNATETKIFITANARALRHFIEQRASRFADPEIRLLATAVWEKLAAESPNLFSDYEKVPLADGTYGLTTKYRKV